MKEIRYFYLRGCPYCRRADRIIAELIAEHPEYASLSIEKLDEQQERKLADSYDYWHVPCLWLGREKLYEADPSESEAEVRERLKAAFDTVLAR